MSPKKATQKSSKSTTKKPTQKSAKSTTALNKKSKGFTDEERAAMKERAQELKAEARRGARAKKTDGESAVLAKIAEMQGPDQALARRLHAIVKASAPALSPKTWYGMPAYAKDGKVVCFFQSALKFKSRYATFGFSDAANLDEGDMRPTSFALKELTAARGKDRRAREESGELRTGNEHTKTGDGMKHSRFIHRSLRLSSVRSTHSVPKITCPTRSVLIAWSFDGTVAPMATWPRCTKETGLGTRIGIVGANRFSPRSMGSS